MSILERQVQRLDTPLDVDMIATEFTILVRRSTRTAADTELGELREMVLQNYRNRHELARIRNRSELSGNASTLQQNGSILYSSKLARGPYS